MSDELISTKSDEITDIMDNQDDGCSTDEPSIVSKTVEVEGDGGGPWINLRFRFSFA